MYLKSRITEERSIHQETIAGHANKDEFTPEEWRNRKLYAMG